MSEPADIRHPKQRLISTDLEGFDSLAELGEHKIPGANLCSPK